MSDKFSNEDLKEIASKLKWKPNELTYQIYYIVISLSFLSFILVIYLIALQKDLNCKFKKISKINLYLISKLEYNTKNLSNFTNDIRYLTKRSERNSDNMSLEEKNKNMPIFANEKENNYLFSALKGL
jgi:hypothetical protein